MSLGASTILLAPIDVPLATAAEIDDLVAMASAGVVIVPSSAVETMGLGGLMGTASLGGAKVQ